MDAMNMRDHPRYRDVVDAPEGAVAVLAAGVVAAGALLCGWLFLKTDGWLTALASPFLVGVLTGFASRKHPVGYAVLIVLLAAGLGVVQFGGDTYGYYFLFWLDAALPIGLGLTIFGALCTSTIRRYVRGRRARALFGGLL
jgi:hypothetical protein